MTPDSPVADPARLDLPLGSPGVISLMLAQFLSAFADNAVLIAAIALLKRQGHLDQVPLLQIVFVLPYVLLAPFAGAYADALPKARAMMLANGLKLGAAAGLAAGVHPLLCYGIIGTGAAAYSPAKYGILGQLVGTEKLVRANGVLEGSTIVAILLGVLAGGMLADYALSVALYAILATYALAAAANLFVPRVAAERPGALRRPGLLARKFGCSCRQLWQDRDSRFSLLGTSIFWGGGATVRVLLFAWVPAVLLINDSQTPATLMGLVSLGIVLGASLAGWKVTLQTVDRVLPAGIGLGLVTLILMAADSVATAALPLLVLGACGGFFIVPLNALLQERGHRLGGVGQALAVQNLFENTFMLIFVGLYAGAARAYPDPNLALAALGTVLLLAMSALAVSRKTPPAR